MIMMAATTGEVTRTMNPNRVNCAPGRGADRREGRDGADGVGLREGKDGAGGEMSAAEGVMPEG